MDAKTIQRNLYTSGILCVLCLLMCILALFFHWIEIAVATAVLAVIQAYMVCVWLNRKRHPKTHFRTRNHRPS